MSRETPRQPDFYNPTFRRAMPERFNFTCVYCMRVGRPTYDPDGHTWQIDHVVAHSQGGSHDAENLVLACRSCNASKRDRIAPTPREKPVPPPLRISLPPLTPQPFSVRRTPRASLAEQPECCWYSRHDPCQEATHLRCFICGVPACYRHLDAHVARCEQVAA